MISSKLSEYVRALCNWIVLEQGDPPSWLKEVRGPFVPVAPLHRLSFQKPKCARAVEFLRSGQGRLRAGLSPEERVLLGSESLFPNLCLQDS